MNLWEPVQVIGLTESSTEKTSVLSSHEDGKTLEQCFYDGTTLE